MTRTKVFLSYAHPDNRWRKRLVLHLEVLAGLIDIWDDERIGAGEAWLEKIHAQMSQARIAVLLVSASFLTSKFIRNTEVPRLFERHEQDGMTIYPLLIRPCAWEEVPWLARLQMRPADAKPVASLRGARVDGAMANVAREIASIARNARAVDPLPASGGSGPAPDAIAVRPALLEYREDVEQRHDAMTFVPASPPPVPAPVPASLPVHSPQPAAILPPSVSPTRYSVMRRIFAAEITSSVPSEQELESVGSLLFSSVPYIRDGTVRMRVHLLRTARAIMQIQHLTHPGADWTDWMDTRRLADALANVLAELGYDLDVVGKHADTAINGAREKRFLEFKGEDERPGMVSRSGWVEKVALSLIGEKLLQKADSTDPSPPPKDGIPF